MVMRRLALPPADLAHLVVADAGQPHALARRGEQLGGGRSAQFVRSVERNVGGFDHRSPLRSFRLDVLRERCRALGQEFGAVLMQLPDEFRTGDDLLQLGIDLVHDGRRPIRTS
jgi:hypothetical protein